jgi:cobalt-precorrin-5B (C1)-methyltransferase
LKKKQLRSGYTTGACAAAAAKAAASLLLVSINVGTSAGASGRSPLHKVEIPFPDGSRVTFSVHDAGIRNQESSAWASVIKDAGDDPDVTNGTEIVAEATIINANNVGARRAVPLLVIKGGIGVGTVTKPGLPIPIGEPAINPVPSRMIEEAVLEAVDNCRGTACRAPTIEITISVPEGEVLAKKTLNHRLGIVGGISILGTTGIVKPVSTEAWTATISSSMDVAKAMGLNEAVLSAGRTSEKSHMKKYGLPEESYVLMGDYLEYSLKEAVKKGFKKIHLCAQWAKMVKIAMATPQTHVRFGAIDVRKAVAFLNSLGVAVPERQEFNTAREIFEYIQSKYNAGTAGAYCNKPLQKVCNAAKKYATSITKGVPVETFLVSYSGEIITASE